MRILPISIYADRCSLVVQAHWRIAISWLQAGSCPWCWLHFLLWLWTLNPHIHTQTQFAIRAFPPTLDSVVVKQSHRLYHKARRRCHSHNNWGHKTAADDFGTSLLLENRWETCNCSSIIIMRMAVVHTIECIYVHMCTHIVLYYYFKLSYQFIVYVHTYVTYEYIPYNMYVCICVCMYIYIYIYTYIMRILPISIP